MSWDGVVRRGRLTDFRSIPRASTGVMGFLNEVVLAGLMVANLADQCADPLPVAVLHGARLPDFLDERSEGAGHQAVLREQFLGERAETRLLLEDRGHVATLLLKTEVVREVLPRALEAAA